MRSTTRGWVADYIRARANRDRYAERNMLAPFPPEVHDIFRLLADIAVFADPRVVAIATGRQFVKTEGATRKERGRAA